MKIKSYFLDLNTARQSIHKLKTEGFNNAYIDASDNSSYPHMSSISNTGPMARDMEMFSNKANRTYSVIAEIDDNRLEEFKGIIENTVDIPEEYNTTK